MAIPFDDKDEYSKCEYYVLNYDDYTLEDFIHWNRSEMIPEGTPTQHCENWVYDRSIFTETVLSRVRTM